MEKQNIGQEYGLCQFVPFTWQGEGPDTGRPITLMRFSKCNLNCSFCDTRALMRKGPVDLSFKELFDAVERTKYLLVTGGEPLAVNRNASATIELVTAMLWSLKRHGNLKIAIETNGIVKSSSCLCYLVELFKRFNVPLLIVWGLKYRELPDTSPGEILKSDYRTFVHNLEVAKAFDPASTTSVAVKILIPEPSGFDIAEAMDQLVDRNKISVWIMPLGHKLDFILKNSPEATETASMYGFNFSSRLQIVHDFK